MRSLLCSGILLRTASRLAFTESNKQKMKRLVTQSDTNAEVAQCCRRGQSSLSCLTMDSLMSSSSRASSVFSCGQNKLQEDGESERRTKNKHTSACACVLLSRVHPWAPAQAVALAVRVSLSCGIVQWRHGGRVLQRRPVALFTHPSEQDLCKLPGDSLHTRQQWLSLHIYWI